MKLEQVPKGRYVIGVSGGVDSVVLLHALNKNPDIELVVAHFDHGIRSDSIEDTKFVNRLAVELGLPFETERVELGAGASEAVAREVRYEFLNAVRKKHGARAIITAHHQDDLIETAVLNMLRGTKRRGLVSLQSGEQIVRPLLSTTKAEILEYAKANNLQWREDSTNKDLSYKRNHVREIIKNSLNPELRREINEQLQKIAEQNKEIDEVVNEILMTQPKNKINKKLINSMGLAEAYELAAAWLRNNSINFDESTIKRLVIGVRTLQNGSQIDLKDNCYSVVKRDNVVIERRKSV